MIRKDCPAVIAPQSPVISGEWVFSPGSKRSLGPDFQPQETEGVHVRGKFSSNSDKYSQRRRGKLIESN